MKMFFAAVALALVSTPAMAKDEPYGDCPGAVIDYAFYRAKYRDNYVPVSVQVEARRALRACHKAGIKVPFTVAEYNQQRAETFTMDQVLTRPYYRNPVER
jgi:hypothetical protein